MLMLDGLVPKLPMVVFGDHCVLLAFGRDQTETRLFATSAT